MNRVLVVTNNSLRKSNANGFTLLTLLYSFKVEEVIDLSIDGVEPDKDSALATYQTTDKEHLKYFFTKKKLGRIILNEDIKEKENIQTSIGKHKSIKENALGLWIREIIWKYGRWDKSLLYSFIDEYKPTAIMFQCSRTIFMINLVHELSSKYNIPVTIYTGEDEYFHKYPFYKLIKNHLQRKMKKAYKVLFNENVRQVICTHPKLARLYKEEFIINSFAILPPSGIKVENTYIPNIGGSVMYTGNINPNRYSSLIDVATSLYNIDNSIKLDIYSGDMTNKVSRILSKSLNIKIHPPVKKDEVEGLMKKARLLIHVESFRKKDKVLIENAYSTKIADSLASGVPFFVYGPTYAGFGDYFLNNPGIAFYIYKKEELDTALKEALTNEDKRKEVVVNAIKEANDNHSIEHNSNRIMEELFLE